MYCVCVCEFLVHGQFIITRLLDLDLIVEFGYHVSCVKCAVISVSKTKVIYVGELHRVRARAS